MGFKSWQRHSTLNRKVLGSNLGSDIASTLNRKVLGSNLGSYIVSTLNRKVLGSNLGSYIVSTLHRKDLGLNLGSYIVSTLNRKDLGLNLGRNKRAYLLQKFQTSSSTHPDSNSMQTRVFSLAVSGQGFESHCSRLSSATFKIQWSYISTQPVCLHGTYWDFILTLPPNYVPPPKVHFLSGLVQSFLYITCISHAHHWNYLFNLH